MDAMVCRSQDRSTVGAVAVGHEDWSWADEVTSGRCTRVSSAAQSVGRQTARGRRCGPIVARGGWLMLGGAVVCAAKRRETSNKEERMFSLVGLIEYRLTGGARE